MPIKLSLLGYFIGVCESFQTSSLYAKLQLYLFFQVMAKPERGRARITAPTNNGGGATAKTRFWQPSLQSISESAS